MSEKPAYLTRDGRARLEAELEELTTSGRKEVADRIGAAKSLAISQRAWPLWALAAGIAHESTTR